MLILLSGMAVASVVTALAVPLLIRLAWRWRVLDQPGTGHHAHSRPVPRLGGVAVFLGFAAAMVVVAGSRAGGPREPQALLTFDPRAAAMLGAVFVLFLIGLLDDLKDIPPAAKLVGQTLAALMVCAFGFRIETLVFPTGVLVHLGWLGLPLSVLWIVGVSNAFNLIDGIDGLAGAVAVIALAAVAVSAIFTGNTTTIWYSALLATSLACFLRFNSAPARIFLGDSGSLGVGFLLAVLSVKGATRADGATYALVPVFALGYPLLDTGIAIMRRWLRRVPLSRADGRHVHHQLVALGLDVRRAVHIICLGAIGVAALGLCTAFASPFVALATAFAGAAVLVVLLTTVTRMLQYNEFAELAASVSSLLRHARGLVRSGIHARDLARLIVVSRTLDEVSALLADAACDLRVAHISIRAADSITLDESSLAFEADPLWRIEYPVLPRATGGATHAIRPDPFVLTIWCRTDGSDRPAGAERIARILAPALAQWLEMAAARPVAMGYTSRLGSRQSIVSPVGSTEAGRTRVRRHSVAI